jgi:preprotein translocase subunit SecE
MDIIAELRKVTWPTRQEVLNLTTVVLVVAAIIGVFLGLADMGFSWVVEQTILR